MKVTWRLLVVTMLLDLVGIVWILQGLNVLGGSPMTGDPFWAAAGVVVLVVSGLILTVNVLRSRRGTG